MNKKVSFSKHIAAASALFILADASLIYPLSGTNEFGFTAYLTAFLTLAGFYPLAWLITEKVGKNLLYIIFVCIMSLFVGAGTFKNIIKFASQVILPDTPMFFTVLVFAAVIIYFTLKPVESVLKFSLMGGLASVIIILFFFIALTDKYDLRSIYIFRLPDFNSFLPQLADYLINPILQSLILPLFFRLGIGDGGMRQSSAGVMAGGTLVGLCILTPILLFGADLSGELAFPFSSAASTVSVGRLFTRLDGFVFFMYFIAGLIKITVCLYVVKQGLKAIDKSFKAK